MTENLFFFNSWNKRTNVFYWWLLVLTMIQEFLRTCVSDIRSLTLTLTSDLNLESPHTHTHTHAGCKDGTFRLVVFW